jgi:hypothetical protein
VSTAHRSRSISVRYVLDLAGPIFLIAVPNIFRKSSERGLLNLCVQRIAKSSFSLCLAIIFLINNKFNSLNLFAILNGG